MEMLIETIEKYISLTNEDKKVVEQYFHLLSYKKNTNLLLQDQVAHQLFFVKKGAIRQYFYNEDGIERTSNFTFEHEFITDLESFSKQNRAQTNLITLEDTTCFVITCKDSVVAMKLSANINSFFQKVIEQIATDNIKRIQSMLSQSPESQFQSLAEDRKQILQRVPQRYIAQYLGIAPESLSRIRKRILHP